MVLLEIQNINIISLKNTDEKKFHFGQNLFTNAFGKRRLFFLKKLQFSGVNVILFSPEYQKKIFSDKQKDAFLGNKNREIIATGA